MAILTHSRIMVAWGAMAIRTYSHPAMIYRDLQPRIGDMATAAWSRIMADRTFMTVTTITQSVIKNRAFPGFGVMTGATLPGFITGMILWCLMTGATISGVSMIQRLGFPFHGIMTGATVAGVVFFIRTIFIMAGQAVRISAVIHLSW